MVILLFLYSFQWSFLPLFQSIASPCSFVAVSSDQFFLKLLVYIFAIFSIVRRNDFNSLLDVDGLNCNMAVIFSSFSFIPYSFISCLSQVVFLRRESNFPVLYPESWIFSKSVDNVFFWISFYTPLLLTFRLATRVSANAIFILFSTGKMSFCQTDRKFLFQIYNVRSRFLPSLQSCLVHLYLPISLVDRMRSQVQSLITTTVRFVLLFFRSIFDWEIPPFLALVVSIFCNYHLIFLNLMFFLLIYPSWPLLYPRFETDLFYIL